jgi:hypothetical protein
MKNATSPVVTMGNSSPAHIVISVIDGEAYDLFTNRIRQDLLPHDIQIQMMDWPHGWSYYEGDGRWIELPAQSSSRRQGFLSNRIYRARPAPKVTEHVLWWAAGDAAGRQKAAYDTHKITIHHTGDTLPYEVFTSPSGATITVEKAE